MATSLQAMGPSATPIALSATNDGRLIVTVKNDKEPFDRELLSTRYSAKQDFEGAVVGNVIRQTVAFDVSGDVMTVISVIWENESTGAAISAPPSVSEYLVTMIQGDALTLAQLLAAGLATAANQLTSIGYLADIAQTSLDVAASISYAEHAAHQIDESVIGTVYIRKQGPRANDTWLVQRIVTDAAHTTTQYAGVRNNAAITTPTAAWASRTTLVYGDLNAA